MTSLQVTHNWTPQLIAKDKELKEKYGAAAHVTPMSSYAGLERTPKSENISFGNAYNDKTNSAAKKSLLIGAGVLLATAATIAAYIITKGKKNPANILGNKADAVITELQQATGNQSANKIGNIVKEIQEAHDEFAEIKPIVTKLKNGKQKIEFKNILAPGSDNNKIIIVDKEGNFEKLINLHRCNNKVTNYEVFDGVVDFKSNYIKFFRHSLRMKNGYQILLEKNGGWKKNIRIQSNEKAVHVANEDWHKISPEKIVNTEIYKNINGPADVRQYTYNDLKNTVENSLAYKTDKPRVHVKDTKEGLSAEQRADMLELITGKRK